MTKILIVIVAIVFLSLHLTAQPKGRVTEKTTVFAAGKVVANVNVPVKENLKPGSAQKYSISLATGSAAHSASQCPVCGKVSTLSPKEQMKAEVMKQYTCPMHPHVALNRNGICHLCALSIAEKKVNWKAVL